MEENITVLVDAKIEYTKQLTNILVPFIFQGIKSIYKSTVSLCKMNQDGKILMRFQEQLSQIPKWNQEIIDDEYERIIEDSKCDWLDDLVTAVFLSHTKILTAIKSGNKQNKINLKIPKIDHFIHKCYIESAREFWKNPYIFSDQVSHSEYQRNINDGHKIIGTCIEETIRKLLPVKNILREYLGSGFEENTQDDSLLPETYKENLKKMVQKELEVVKNPPLIDNNLLDSLEEIKPVDIGLKKKEMSVESLPDVDLNLENNNSVQEIKIPEESTSSDIPKVLETVVDTPKLDIETLNLEEVPISSESNLNEDTEEKNIEVVFEEKPPEEIEPSEATEVQITDDEVPLDQKTLNKVDSPKDLDFSELELENVSLGSDNVNSTESEEKPMTESENLEELNLDVKEEKSILSEVEELDLSNFSLDSLTTETQKQTSLPDEKPKVQTMETVQEYQSNNTVEELALDDNLESVSLETTNLNEITPVPKVESDNTSLTTYKSEDISLKGVNESETLESKPEIKSQTENNSGIKKIDLQPSAVEEIIKPIESTKIEASKNTDMQDMKSIIKNELYEKELDSNLSEEEFSDGELSDSETRIENMRFRKSGLENLELETLDSDFEIDEGELINFKPVKVQDISFEKTETATAENLKESKNTKTIIIEDDSKKTISKYNKPGKKNFKFFD